MKSEALVLMSALLQMNTKHTREIKARTTQGTRYSTEMQLSTV